MDEDKKQISNVSVFVSHDFSINESDTLIPAGDFPTLEEFRIYLQQKIADLLENKYNTLINILYRIDVSENKLGELFGDRNRKDIPAVLADLIIERSLQKLKFRQSYKDGEI
jgi:hypothetical protein